MTLSAETPPRSSRTQFWILVTAFLAPLLIAFLLYYGVDGWRPTGSTNHGELITPPRPLPQSTLTSANDAPLAPALMQDRWTLVFIGEGQCDARCKEALTLMRQTRIALNDDLPRVQRVFLATAQCCDQNYLDAEHPDLIVAKADTPAGVELLSHFPDAAGGRIYIVDPLGNLMMSYPRDAEPRGLLDDLKKLLKLSHIG